MVQQTPARQADETICLRCSTVVKRDVGLCPECGARISVGPQHNVPAPITSGGASTTTYEQPSEDVAGIGRYILNFVLAGLIGLALTFFLRRQGWLATWISIPIFILIVVIFASAG